MNQCGLLSGLRHRYLRFRDRTLVLPMIKAFPEPTERLKAWDLYMSWPESYHWRCPCSREAKHPMVGVPMKDILFGDQS